MAKLPIPTLIVAAAIALHASPLGAADGPPNGSTPQEMALVRDDPRFVPAKLVLADVPKATGRRVALFNGHDLSNWDSWLGVPDPTKTYTPNPGKPIGLNHDTTHVFSVVQEDGAPALFANGKLFGGLLTKGTYRNYHLRLQFKWGKNSWIPNFPRNNGILYHAHGPYGAFFGSWMSAVEFEIVPHSVGMLLTVGASRGATSFADVDWHVGARVPVGGDPSLPYPYRRFMPGGRLVPIVVPAFNVDANSDAERPLGEWNTLDLYVLGDRSVHVVNGVPVMVARNLTTRDRPGGPTRPLTHGRIQLQSEGAETYFRNITLEPISRLPTVRAQRVP